MRTSNNGYTLCGKYWIEYRNFLGSIRGYWKSRPYDDFNSAIWRLDSGTKIVWMLCWEQRRFHLANVYYTSKGSRYGDHMRNILPWRKNCVKNYVISGRLIYINYS